MSQQLQQLPNPKFGHLVLLDVPEGTEIGIDWKYWNVGPRFKGLKDIPTGTHFIYYSSVSKTGDTGPRTGFFHCFSAGELVVKKWNSQTEDIDDLSLSDEELSRYVDNWAELVGHLGPYPMESYKTWVSLSSWITGDLVSQLAPRASPRITSVAQYQSVPSNSAQRKQQQQQAVAEGSGHNRPEGGNSRSLDADGLPELHVIPGTLPMFTRVPNRALIPTDEDQEEDSSSDQGGGSSRHRNRGALVSRHSIDRSFTLTSLLAERGWEPALILGEMQYAFICFALGNLMEGFEQWRCLIDLLCHCETAIQDHTSLYTALVSLLYHEIQLVPQDLFTDIVTMNNFLLASLHSLCANVTATAEAAGQQLTERVQGLQLFLARRFGWDLSGDWEDEAPVVVDLPEEDCQV